MPFEEVNFFFIFFCQFLCVESIGGAFGMAAWGAIWRKTWN
jgi:hypothetical protein